MSRAPRGPSNDGSSNWRDIAQPIMKLVDRHSSRAVWSAVAISALGTAATLGSNYVLFQELTAERPEDPPPPIPPTPEPAPKPKPSKPAQLPAKIVLDTAVTAPLEVVARPTQALFEFGMTCDCLLSVVPPQQLGRPLLRVEESDVETFRLTDRNGSSIGFEGVRYKGPGPATLAAQDDPYGSYLVVALEMPLEAQMADGSDLLSRKLSVVADHGPSLEAGSAESTTPAADELLVLAMDDGKK